MWKIQMQEEAVPFSSAKIQVKCKAVKFYPIEGYGETQFGRLRTPFLRVVIVDDKGYVIKINQTGGMDGKFTIIHPDTVDYPTYKVKKNGVIKYYADTLAPKVTSPGMKETYETVSSFVERISKFVGYEMTEEILNAFAGKMVKALSRAS